MKKLLLSFFLASAIAGAANADRSITSSSGSASTVTVSGISVGYGLLSVTNSGGLILMLNPNATSFILNSSSASPTQQVFYLSSGAINGQFNVTKSSQFPAFQLIDSDSASKLILDISTLPLNGGVGPQVAEPRILATVGVDASGNVPSFTIRASTYTNNAYAHIYGPEIQMMPSTTLGAGTIQFALGPTGNVSLNISSQTLSAYVPINFYSADLSGYTALKASASLTASQTLVLPPNGGVSGQGIMTDGNGNLFFNSVLSTGTPNFSGSTVTYSAAIINGTRTDNSTTTYTGKSSFAGTTDGSAAATGNYAEEVSSTVAGNKAWSLTTGVYIDVATMTVPAGDWLIYGCVGFVGAPTGTALVSSLTTFGGNNAGGQLVADNTNQIPTMPTAAADVNLSIPLPQHIIVSASTAYYLKAAAVFTVGSVKAYGTIRRVRNPH